MDGRFLSEAIGQIDDRFLEECGEAVNTERSALRGKLSWRRIAAAVALLPLIAALLIAVSVPVLAAAGNRAAYDLLYLTSPGAAQALKPVRQSSEDQGIRMEVVSASVEGNEALVYLSVRDLQEDRLDETVSLYDSYGIRYAGNACGSSCQRVSYDPERKEATFLIRLWWDGETTGLAGKKVTFFVNELKGGQQEVLDYEFRIPGEAFLGEAKSKTVIWTGASGNGTPDLDDGSRTVRVLDPGEPIGSPADGIRITGAGIIQGEMRLQIAYDDPLRTGAHTRIQADMVERSYSWFNEDQTVKYQEFVLTEKILEDHAVLKADFRIFRNSIEGNWEVTFRLPKTTEEEPETVRLEYLTTVSDSGVCGMLGYPSSPEEARTVVYYDTKTMTYRTWYLPDLSVYSPPTMFLLDGRIHVIESLASQEANNLILQDGPGRMWIIDTGTGEMEVRELDPEVCFLNQGIEVVRKTGTDTVYLKGAARDEKEWTWYELDLNMKETHASADAERIMPASEDRNRAEVRGHDADGNRYAVFSGEMKPSGTVRSFSFWKTDLSSGERTEIFPDIYPFEEDWTIGTSENFTLVGNCIYYYGVRYEQMDGGLSKVIEIGVFCADLDTRAIVRVPDSQRCPIAVCGSDLLFSLDDGYARYCHALPLEKTVLIDREEYLNGNDTERAFSEAETGAPGESHPLEMVTSQWGFGTSNNQVMPADTGFFCVTWGDMSVFPTWYDPDSMTRKSLNAEALLPYMESYQLFTVGDRLIACTEENSRINIIAPPYEEVSDSFLVKDRNGKVWHINYISAIVYDRLNDAIYCTLNEDDPWTTKTAWLARVDLSTGTAEPILKTAGKRWLLFGSNPSGMLVLMSGGRHVMMQDGEADVLLFDLKRYKNEPGYAGEELKIGDRDPYAGYVFGEDEVYYTGGGILKAYDYRTGGTREIGPVPDGRHTSSQFVTDGKFYVPGYISTAGEIKTVWYDTVSGEWLDKPSPDATVLKNGRTLGALYSGLSGAAGDWYCLSENGATSDLRDREYVFVKKDDFWKGGFTVVRIGEDAEGS